MPSACPSVHQILTGSLLCASPTLGATHARTNQMAVALTENYPEGRRVGSEESCNHGRPGRASPPLGQ